ncbi:MAG: hypothetical protein KGQ52_13570 [Alphaproteobacteria bacterium]|nr:hypothetical protein [Alphaproteobacteria bacterium]
MISPAALAMFAVTAQSQLAAAPAGTPDFTLSGATATPAWNSAVAFGDLIPNAATPAGAYFVLVGEPAGLAVVNG